jgi:hypothetical protein
LIELALRTWCLVDAADAFLLSLPSIVDRRHRRVWQIVLDRQRLAAALEATLARLGLERRAKPVPDLATYLKARAAERGGEGEVSLPPGFDSYTRTLEVPPSDEPPADKETT